MANFRKSSKSWAVIERNATVQKLITLPKKVAERDRERPGKRPEWPREKRRGNSRARGTIQGRSLWRRRRGENGGFETLFINLRPLDMVTLDIIINTYRTFVAAFEFYFCRKVDESPELRGRSIFEANVASRVLKEKIS